MTVVVIDTKKLEQRRQRVVKSRDTSDRHFYFNCVARTRYILRKVFRMVEEEAKRAGIDPLAQQALIQIYGSEHSMLRVKELAERLDVSSAFASSMVKLLSESGYASRHPDKVDKRVTWIGITKAGRELLHRIDEQVQIHVDYFTRTLSSADREAAMSILMFYIGISFHSRLDGS